MSDLFKEHIKEDEVVPGDVVLFETLVSFKQGIVCEDITKVYVFDYYAFELNISEFVSEGKIFRVKVDDSNKTFYKNRRKRCNDKDEILNRAKYFLQSGDYNQQVDLNLYGGFIKFCLFKNRDREIKKFSIEFEDINNFLKTLIGFIIYFAIFSFSMLAILVIYWIIFWIFEGKIDDYYSYISQLNEFLKKLF